MECKGEVLWSSPILPLECNDSIVLEYIYVFHLPVFLCPPVCMLMWIAMRIVSKVRLLTGHRRGRGLVLDIRGADVDA